MKLIVSNQAKYWKRVLKIHLVMKFMPLDFCLVLCMSSRGTFFPVFAADSRDVCSVLHDLCLYCLHSASFSSCLYLNLGKKVKLCKISLPVCFWWKFWYYQSFSRSSDVSTEPQNNFYDLSYQSICKYFFGAVALIFVCLFVCLLLFFFPICLSSMWCFHWYCT